MKQTLQKLYNEQSAALASKDIRVYFASYAASYVGTEKSGKTTDLASYKERLAQFLRHAVRVQSGGHVRSVVLSGNTALALCDGYAQWTFVNAQTGKDAVVRFSGVERDTWTKTGGGWLLTTSKTLSETDTLNGVVMPETKKLQPHEPVLHLK